MLFGGRATGRPNFNPFIGLRALAGAFLARSPRALRSPLASTSVRLVGTLASTACRSMTLSPSTTPRRNPSFDSNPTIFMAIDAPDQLYGRDYSETTESASIHQPPLIAVVVRSHKCRSRGPPNPACV